jgi:riboflavin kinase/FMN adenylyltransferase
MIIMGRKKTAVAIGRFDGFHKGHRKLMSVLKERAGNNLECVAAVLKMPGTERILPFDMNCKLIEESGVRSVVLDFKDIKKLSPGGFVKKILVDELGAALVVAGENFRFGYKREGDIGTLKVLGRRFGFSVEAVPLLRVGGAAVSSSRIRECLKGGLIESAKELLGYDPVLAGREVKGRGIGKKIGLPTINLKTDRDVIIPKSGVYVSVAVISGRRFKSLLYIGTRPTFGGRGKSIELHVLDDFGDSIGVEGKEIEVRLMKRIRDDLRFRSPEKLLKQVEKDREDAEGVFKDRREFLK